MFHFTFCNVFCVSVLCCIIQVAMTSSVCKYIHKEVDTRIFQTYPSREWCIKPNQILMSWSLLCMCCEEQLPLLFIVQCWRSGTDCMWWSTCICTWLVRIYICYIYSTNRFDRHGKEEVLKLLLENGPLCHAMALERTLSWVLMLWSRHWRQ